MRKNARMLRASSAPPLFSFPCAPPRRPRQQLPPPPHRLRQRQRRLRRINYYCWRQLVYNNGAMERHFGSILPLSQRTRHLRFARASGRLFTFHLPSPFKEQKGWTNVGNLPQHRYLCFYVAIHLNITAERSTRSALWVWDSRFFWMQ